MSDAVAIVEEKPSNPLPGSQSQEQLRAIGGSEGSEGGGSPGGGKMGESAAVAMGSCGGDGGGMSAVQ